MPIFPRFVRPAVYAARSIVIELITTGVTGFVLCASFDLGNLICHALQNVQNTGAQNAAFL
jgi:hypothetical protein